MCYWVCDARESPLIDRVTEPFVALGRNAILLFVLSGLLAKTLIYLKWPDPALSLGGWIYLIGLHCRWRRPTTPRCFTRWRTSRLLFALLAALHRRRIYLTV